VIESDGLFDLQVNGFAGIDFNDAAITADRLDAALEAMLATGVTGCLPTLITAHEHELSDRIRALDAAVATSRLGPRMVAGYHVEGPFLCPEPGFAGCHPPDAMRDPDAGLYERLQRGLERPILLVTLAPERAGAIEAIRALRVAGCCVAMAHTSAGFADVAAAADAGLSMSTHLGNSLPPSLHKTQNPLLAQLGEPRLAACFIADGHHLSPEALGAMLRLKGMAHSVLVTDATSAAAAPPGRYRFANLEIERSADGVVRVPGQANLAGSALTLDDAVRNAVAWSIADAPTALRLASTNARAAVASAAKSRGGTMAPGRVHWTGDLRIAGVSL
jgi:N-acetylglucosamine-6-phosphate deacetylase